MGLGTILAAGKFLLGCRICLIIMGLIAYGTAADLHGRHKEREKWQAREAAAELAAAQRDQQQTEIAGTDDDRLLASILKSTTTDQEKINAFKSHLSQHEAAACRLSVDDVAGLRLDEPDAKVRRKASTRAQDHGAGEGTAVGRDARAALGDYVGALRLCNRRIMGSREWYGGVRGRYGGARL